MTPITIELDALPATLTDCVTLYRRVDQVADDCRGAILKHIRDERLYKQSGHGTFEAFVDAEFNMSRSRAYQLIDDFDVRQNVQNCRQKPLNAGQTAELAKLPAEEQADAWEEVVAEAHPPPPGHGRGSFRGTPGVGAVERPGSRTRKRPEIPVGK